jgi:hypothetical protein
MQCGFVFFAFLVNYVKCGSGTDLVIRLLPTDEEVAGSRFGSG